MESKTKIFGHPAHTLTIVFPLGLLSTAVVFDLLAAVTRKPKFSQTAFWMLISGLIGGAVSAPLGYNDWRHIPNGTRAKAIGRWHGLGNLLVMALFGGSAALRRGDDKKPGVAGMGLALAGAGVAVVSGWLGGELVNRLGVGVDDGAHLDAPNSLSGLPAVDGAEEGPV